MRVLITGANGYIGKHVVKEFLNNGDEVLVSDFSFKGIDERAIRMEEPIFTGDKEIFEKVGKPDVLVHLAWRDGFVHNSNAHMEDLSSHVVFLQNMIDGGLKYLSVMGSMHEVGYWEGAIDENTPCNPQSLYGISKNALRNSVELSCKLNDVLFQWIRGFYIVGNSEKGASIFSKITAASKENKKEFPFTTGINQYDFIDYEPFCNQIANVCINNDVLGIINCCSGKPESLASRVERFIIENNYDIKLKYGAFPDRPYDSLAVWGDNSKIQQIIELNRGNK